MHSPCFFSFSILNFDLHYDGWSIYRLYSLHEQRGPGSPIDVDKKTFPKTDCFITLHSWSTLTDWLITYLTNDKPKDDEHLFVYGKV